MSGSEKEERKDLASFLLYHVPACLLLVKSNLSFDSIWGWELN